ncbi:MAG: YlbF family regulator [Bacillota bacterium]
MSKIMELARMLADALQASDEAAQYKKARETVKAHAAASIMYQDFLRKQLEIQKKQMAGEKIEESSIQEIQKVFDIIKINPYINNLLMAEGRLLQLVMEVQKTVNSAVSGLFPKEEEGGTGEMETGKTT